MFVSPGTVRDVDGHRGRRRERHLAEVAEGDRRVWPGSISCTFSVFVIGPPCEAGRSIVSVTGICTSCELPPL